MTNDAVAVAETPLLQVEEFSTDFATADGVVRAVDGVSFSLQQGRTLGIVGESGSGKTVLARSIMQLLPGRQVSRRGRVRLMGVDIIDAPTSAMRKIWSAQMAMVFQDPMASLHPLKPVGTQIVESLREHLQLSRAEAKRRAIDLLRSLHIPEPARRYGQYPHQLSGGMRQRVTIAIALACDPQIVFADEPTTALDVTVQAQILDLLATHQRDRNMAMVLVSHDLAVVAGRTHEVMVMYAGQVVEQGATRTVLRHPRMPYTEALLRSTPRLDSLPHAPLPAIPGRPPSPLHFPLGCRFAPRCSSAQDRCLVELPPLVAATDDPRHLARCWYPVGTADGDQALEANRQRGHTAAGLAVRRSAEVAV